jgi:hypothetical protein
MLYGTLSLPLLMTVSDFTAFMAAIPPNLWVGGLIAGFFLCLKAYIDGQTARDVQGLVNAGQADKLRSEERQLRMKLDEEKEKR